MKYLKQPFFLIGLLFFLLITSGSFIFSSVKEPSAPSKILYDESGTMIDRAPFKPNSDFPLGSDQDGNNYLFVLLEGAKYTLGLVLLVTAGRMLFSIIGAFVLLVVPNFIKRLINYLSDIFYFAPLSILAYLLIAPVLVVFSWSYSELTQFTVTITVLILLTLPILSMQIANEITILSKEEYIRHAHILGGSKFHVFFKHILPCLSPKLLLLTVQQAGQTLAIIAHLAFLKVFIGGSHEITYSSTGPSFNEVTYIRTLSESFEWGGLIVQNWSFYYAAPRLVIAPVICFVICIIAINLMVSGIARADKKQYKLRKFKPHLIIEKSSKSFSPIKKKGVNAS
jgi:peptide/nickel transport system permease protein